MAHDNYVAVIGPPKTGTTWMHRYLSERTDAAVPTIKEFHWFDETDPASQSDQRIEAIARRKARRQERVEEIRKRLDQHKRTPVPRQQEQFDRVAMQTDADYRRFFTSRYGPDDCFVDVTPAYSRLSRAGYERMKALFPKARIVTFLRNPADHRWSRMAHMQRNRYPDVPFDEIISTRFLNFDLDSPIRYAEVRNGLLDVFDPDQVLTLFTEDIFSDRQEETLAELRAFMGISQTSAEPFEFTGNKGHYPKMSTEQRAAVVRAFAPTWDFAETLMGRLPAKWEADRAAFL